MDNEDDIKEEFMGGCGSPCSACSGCFTEEEDSFSFEEQKVEPISEVDILKKEIDTLKETLLRVAADAENTKKRALEDSKKAKKYAITSFAGDIVDVAENFFLAIENAPKDKDEATEGFINGIDMIKKELMKILENNGVKRIYPLDEKFNHDYHQAVSQVDGDAESGTVVQVIKAGYSMEDRILCPALVSVTG